MYQKFTAPVIMRTKGCAHDILLTDIETVSWPTIKPVFRIAQAEKGWVYLVKPGHIPHMWVIFDRVKAKVNNAQETTTKGEVVMTRKTTQLEPIPTVREKFTRQVVLDMVTGETFRTCTVFCEGDRARWMEGEKNVSAVTHGIWVVKYPKPVRISQVSKPSERDAQGYTREEHMNDFDLYRMLRAIREGRNKRESERIIPKGAMVRDIDDSMVFMHIVVCEGGNLMGYTDASETLYAIEYDGVMYRRIS